MARRMVGIRLLRVGCPGGDIMQLMAAGKCFETVKNWIVGGNIEIRDSWRKTNWLRRTFVAKHGVIVWRQRPKRVLLQNSNLLAAVTVFSHSPLNY